MNNEFDVQPPMAPEHTTKKTSAAPDHVKSQFVGDSAVIDTAISQGVSPITTQDEFTKSSKNVAPIRVRRAPVDGAREPLEDSTTERAIMTNEFEVEPTINQIHSDKQFADDPAIIAAVVARACASIDSDDDLRETLKHLDKMLPGLPLQHYSPDGELIPPFRPDNPKGGPKCFFLKDSGSVLSINPTVSLNQSTVVIVEGAKQMIFASAYAPDDTLIVGIQGCWGWSSKGQALASLDATVKGKDVIVIFDADLSGNPDVYAAGASLNETLAIIGAKSITFAPIPGAKTVGLDDFLSRRPEADRADVFAGILSKAVPFTKVRKPAKRKVSVDSKDATLDIVSELLGEVCAVEFEKIDDDGTIVREQEGHPVAGVVDERNVRRVDTLLHAAVNVDSIITNIDDLTVGSEPTYSYHLKVQVGPEGDSREFIIKDVSSDALGNVRTWLDRGGIEGLQIPFGRNGLGLAGGLRIANAIRAAMEGSDFKQRVSRPHSGWIEYEGEHWWSDTTGSHGATRKRDDVIAKLEGTLAALDVPGYHENYEEKHLYAALKELFDAENYLYDSTSFVAGISAMFWALAGGDPDAVLYILGGESSGKSSIIGLVSSLLSKHWGTKLSPMATSGASAAYLRDLTKQPHNMLLVVHDVRGRTSGRSHDTQADGLENLIRPGYTGGGAGSSKKVRITGGDWVQEKPKDNRFFLCIVGEVLPEAERQSSIERTLVIEVDTHTSMRPKGDTPTGESGYEHFIQLSRDRALMPITSAYLANIAQLINETGSLDAWRESLNTARTEITAAAVATQVTDVSARVQNVAGTFLAGATMFLEWVMAVGYITNDERVEIESRWHDQLIKATLRHSVVNLYSGGEGEIVISKVIDAVASGRYAIDTAVGNQILVGVSHTVKFDGEPVECIALLPGIVAQIVGPNNLAGRLDKLLVRDRAGKRTRSVRVDKVMTRCFVVRKSDWNKIE